MVLGRQRHQPGRHRLGGRERHSHPGEYALSGSAHIGGNAYASGTISYSNGQISGAIVTPNDGPALASQTMPVEYKPPTVVNPLPASNWSGTEYTNYVTVTSAQCSAAGFATGTGAGSFYADVTTPTTPTVVDASACSAFQPNVTSPTCVYALKTDIAVVVSGLTIASCNSFQSATTTAHNFSIIQPSTSGTITFSNGATFGTSTNPLNLLVWTNGTFDGSGGTTISAGQILAQNTVTAGAGFSLTFSSAAAMTLPGTTTTVSGTTTPSLSVLRRYVTR